LIRSA